MGGALLYCEIGELSVVADRSVFERLAGGSGKAYNHRACPFELFQ